MRYRIRNFGDMIADSGRMDAYVEAMRRVITRESVVLDVGTGTGIFAMLACRLGARRVFAVEPSDAIVVAKEIASRNGLADRIEFIQGLSTHIDLPERADVMVSDLRGILPLYGGHLQAIADARARLLVPGAKLVPAADSLWIGVVEAAEAHAGLTRPWETSRFGIDMEPAARMATHGWAKASFRARQLLTEATRWADLDYSSARAQVFEARVRLAPRRAGTAHGLALWFDGVLAEGVAFSNAPADTAHVYGQGFFPWPRPQPLAVDDVVHVHVKAAPLHGEYLWSWHTRIESADARIRAEFSQSDFEGAPFSTARLRRMARTADNAATPRKDADSLSTS